MNALAPLALMQAVLPRLAEGARIVNVTSDAAVEPYEGWGGYGSAKAALEQLTAVFAAEQPALRVYAVDPGDMNTRMHQDAYPGRGHLRPAGAGAERARPARADRGRPAERALLGRRARRGARVSAALAFALPPALEAAEPPEARGLARDQVRLMVARAGEPLAHARFLDLPRFLRPGDLLVVNESATLPAALRAQRADGTAIDAPPLDARSRGDPERWIVELRRDGARFRGARCGERLALAGGGVAELVAPYLSAGRLWIAALELPAPLLEFLDAARRADPLRAPAARLAARRPPDDLLARPRQRRDAERRPAVQPARAGAARRRGRRRAARAAHRRQLAGARRAALSRALRGPGDDGRARERRARGGRARDRRRHDGHARAGDRGGARRHRVAPAPGWTSLTITPERGVRAVDGLITGWHEPDASHLLLLEAVPAGRWSSAPTPPRRAAGYRWHEFGDSHLLLP